MPPKEMQMRKTNQLAIPDLSSKVTLRSLLDAFSKYEKEMTSVKLSKQRRGGDDELQVGYVEFGDVDVTEKAYGDGNIRVDGETKALHYAKRKEMRRDRGVASAKRLFVSGIPSDTDKDELSRLLGDCKVSRSEKGKNFVFAEYESSEKKEEAMSRLNNMEFKSVKLFATPAYEKAAPSARPNKKRTDSD